MQTTKVRKIKRSQHVWHERVNRGDWKCVMCGAVSENPALLEAEDRAAEKYEPLTTDERQLCRKKD